MPPLTEVVDDTPLASDTLAFFLFAPTALAEAKETLDERSSSSC
jgi:hypothetical protein